MIVAPSEGLTPDAASRPFVHIAHGAGFGRGGQVRLVWDFFFLRFWILFDVDVFNATISFPESTLLQESVHFDAQSRSAF